MSEISRKQVNFCVLTELVSNPYGHTVNTLLKFGVNVGETAPVLLSIGSCFHHTLTLRIVENIIVRLYKACTAQNCKEINGDSETYLEDVLGNVYAHP